MVRGQAKVAPSGVSSAQVKSSVSLTKVECAVRMSVKAMASTAAMQWSAKVCSVMRSVLMSAAGDAGAGISEARATAVMAGLRRRC